MALSWFKIESCFAVGTLESCFEYGSWLLHELVAVAAAFEDAGFETSETSGTVDDLAMGDLCQQPAAMSREFGPRDEVARQQHPRVQDILAGAGEADLTGWRVMQHSRRRGRADMVEVERLLDRTDVESGVGVAGRSRLR